MLRFFFFFASFPGHQYAVFGCAAGRIYLLLLSWQTDLPRWGDECLVLRVVVSLCCKRFVGTPMSLEARQGVVVWASDVLPQFRKFGLNPSVLFLMCERDGFSVVAECHEWDRTADGVASGWVWRVPSLRVLCASCRERNQASGCVPVGPWAVR